MARKKHKSDGGANVPEKFKRLGATVRESLHRKTGSYAKAHGITVSELVASALEARMSHWYTVDRNASQSPQDGPRKGEAGTPGPDAEEGAEAA